MTSSLLIQINFCVKMNPKEDSLSRLLQRAIRNEDLATLNWILPTININEHFIHFGTPLHFAVLHGKIAVVEFLLQAKASPSVRTSSVLTPLHTAAQHNFFEIADLLIKGGADINAQNILGQTPLFSATIAQSAEVVQILLSNHVDASIADFYNRTPFMVSLAYRGDDCIARSLFLFENNFNAKCAAGFSLLQHAIRAENTLAPVLVEMGAAINLTNSECYNLLLEILAQENAIAFRKVFPHLRYVPLHYKRLFRSFLQCFNAIDWEECLLVVLNSNQASKFIDEDCISWKKGYDSLCTEIIICFDFHQSDQPFRMAVLRKLLNLGMKVYWGDLVSTQYSYGWKEEFKLLLQYPLSSDCGYRIDTIHKLLARTIDPTSITERKIKSTIEKHCRSILNSNLSVNAKLIKLLEVENFFELGPILSKMNQIPDEITAKFREKPNVPRLLELTRHKVLTDEASKSENTTAFYMRLEKLNVPIEWRKVLILKALFIIRLSS